jgi:hypothetical protein
MHFTYKEHDKTSDLQQGDLLEIKGPLKDVLREYHNYYASNGDYKYLMVLTQTCDLVRRKGEPLKSKYISIAAVKLALKALDKEFAHQWQTDAEHSLQVLNKEIKGRVRGFVEKLLNNNQAEYFYLEPDATLGFANPMVAFLKLSVPLRAEEHYGKCMAARIGQLNPEFQAKLGWLVGNSYSRVGTADWLPDNATPDDYRDRIESLTGNYVWSDVGAIEDLRKAERKLKDGNGPDARLTEAEAKSILTSFAKRKEARKDARVEKLAHAVMGHVRVFVPEITGDALTALQKRLCSVDDIRRHVKNK